MTLILSLVADSVVVQVSDRRVSLVQPDDSLLPRDDITNKAVLFCSRSLLAFTGFAELEGLRTDLWIAERLRHSDDLGCGFERLRADLNELFLRRTYAGGPMSVVAAGFKMNADGSLTPYYAVVSNQFREGGWRAKPYDDFWWSWEGCPTGAWGLFEAPKWLTAREFASLKRTMGRAAERTGDVANAIRLMSNAIRAVAQRLGPTSPVGRDLMLTVLPRASAAPSPDVMALSSGPMPETPTFLYLPAEQEPVAYGPTFVCGGAVMTDFVSRPLGEADRIKAQEEAERFRAEQGPQLAYLVAERWDVGPNGQPCRTADIPAGISTPFGFYYHSGQVLVFADQELPPPARRLSAADVESLRSSWTDDLPPVEALPRIADP